MHQLNVSRAALESAERDSEEVGKASTSTSAQQQQPQPVASSSASTPQPPTFDHFPPAQPAPLIGSDGSQAIPHQIPLAHHQPAPYASSSHLPPVSHLNHMPGTLPAPIPHLRSPSFPSNSTMNPYPPQHDPYHHQIPPYHAHTDRPTYFDRQLSPNILPPLGTNGSSPSFRHSGLSSPAAAAYAAHHQQGPPMHSPLGHALSPGMHPYPSPVMPLPGGSRSPSQSSTFPLSLAQQQATYEAKQGSGTSSVGLLGVAGSSVSENSNNVNGSSSMGSPKGLGLAS